MTTLRPTDYRQVEPQHEPGAGQPVAAAPADWARWVGWAAVVFSLVYWVSDLTEVVQGDFTTARLSLTYAGEAALPLFVLGLCAAQRPRIGRLGLFGAVAYAYSYVFFTCTVMYALVADTPDYHALSDVFGVWMTVHGAVLVVGGLAFGVAVIRAADLRRSLIRRGRPSGWRYFFGGNGKKPLVRRM